MPLNAYNAPLNTIIEFANKVNLELSVYGDRSSLFKDFFP